MERSSIGRITNCDNSPNVVYALSLFYKLRIFVMCRLVMVHSQNPGVSMSWIIAVVVLVVVGYLLDREIYFYEGVHLGPRVQAWLYDRWSKKYDQGKRESQLRDNEMLAKPLLAVLKNVPEPFILDFATGTGRLSFALLSQPEFNGHIIAIDLSQGMLERAAVKLAST